MQGIDKAELVKEVKQALYASKITSYAQGLNIIKAKSAEKDWGVDIGSMARIWKVCLVRRGFKTPLLRSAILAAQISNVRALSACMHVPDMAQAPV